MYFSLPLLQIALLMTGISFAALESDLSSRACLAPHDCAPLTIASATPRSPLASGESLCLEEVPFCAWFEMKDDQKNGFAGRYRTVKNEFASSGYITYFEVRNRYPNKVRFKITFTYENGTKRTWTSNLGPDASEPWALDTRRVVAYQISGVAKA